MSDAFYTLDEIRENFNGPELVFADNPRGLFGFGIKLKTRGTYSHFCWRIGPDRIANQTLTFQDVPLDSFRGYHLKFVSNPDWTVLQKANLTNAILSDLSLPWYSTLYDVPGVVFRLFGLRWNLGKAFFCSERGSYLALVDPEYALKSPTPTELNLWTKARGDRYKVMARYSPD